MNFEGYEISDYQLEIEELSVQLADMLNVALHFAGVKKAKMEEALDAYLDEMDEVLGENDDAEMGTAEIIKVINHLKKTRADLFS
ncbi:MAG: hypothetical protein ACK5LP_08280 [Campylobacteraceae bacterium]